MNERRIHLVTREDCTNILRRLVEIFKMLAEIQPVDFLVYGSYYGGWRDGLSDVDGILYFRERRPSHPTIRSAFFKAQSQVALLYRDFDFLTPGFFGDIFIIDKLHGDDGRFIILDKTFFVLFERPNHYEVALGTNFINQLRPVYLRNQDEFYLAHGMHKLRNYLLFEAPLNSSSMSFESAMEALKYLLVLPREASKVVGKPTAGFQDAIEVLNDFFPEIDYLPLRRLWEKSQNYHSLIKCLIEWHEFGNVDFVNAVECFELTLAVIVQKITMNSVVVRW